MIQQINLSPSFLTKVIEKGYDYAVGEKLGLFPKEDTGAMSDGRLLHAIIAEKLGGEPTKAVTSPFDSYRTKEAREWRDSQPDDTFIVTAEKLALFNTIAERVINHSNVKPLLVNATPERIVEQELNGYNVKGIIDVYSEQGEKKNVIDWKFVSSLNFDSFAKKALYMHYDLQAAIYDFLKKPTHVYFGVIENQAPYRIKLFWCDPSFLDSGADKFSKAFTILSEANWREPNFDIAEIGELMSWENHNG